MDHFWFIAGSYAVTAVVLVGIVAWVVTGGRTVVHTEHLAYLLAEMQVLNRAHPGAQW